MAIYSLHHSSIGKSTQAQAYTAGAHVSYICRKSAVSEIRSARVPPEPGKLQEFLRRNENSLRKNARVADKLMIALPRELTAEQRHALVESFAEEITAGRAMWFAAFHDKGKDAANPHCHLVILDRDGKSGKRVFGTSEKGSTERLRRMWQDHANGALAAATRRERIDHRTLEAQGIRRRPTIHVGVTSRQMIKNGVRPTSRVRMQRNHCQARSRERSVAYPRLDEGKLRLTHNVEIRRLNLRASRGEGREDEYWAAIDQDAFDRDITQLRRLNAVLERTDDGRHTLRARDERGPER